MSQLLNETEEIKLYQAIEHASEILKAYHKADAARDSRLLMRYLLKCNEMGLILNRDMPLPSHIVESYMYLVAKRAQGTPLQYITNSQEFMGLDFFVDERVLIPRQDTETLVETLLHRIKEESLYEAIEVGTGSGCISVSLTHFIEEMHFTAIDISQEALDVARKNIKYHHMEEQITLLKSDLFSEYKGKQEVDLIVSNPPYISKEEYAELMQEVRCYEPSQALTDGQDGLCFYKVISHQAKQFLRKGGLLAYEIGYNQAQDILRILEEEGYKELQVIKDLPGKDRVILARNPL